MTTGSSVLSMSHLLASAACFTRAMYSKAYHSCSNEYEVEKKSQGLNTTNSNPSKKKKIHESCPESCLLIGFGPHPVALRAHSWQVLGTMQGTRDGTWFSLVPHTSTPYNTISVIPQSTLACLARAALDRFPSSM